LSSLASLVGPSASKWGAFGGEITILVQAKGLPGGILCSGKGVEGLVRAERVEGGGLELCSLL
jgi:hypothetical protein